MVRTSLLNLRYATPKPKLIKYRRNSCLAKRNMSPYFSNNSREKAVEFCCSFPHQQDEPQSRQ